MKDQVYYSPIRKQKWPLNVAFAIDLIIGTAAASSSKLIFRPLELFFQTKNVNAEPSYFVRYREIMLKYSKQGKFMFKQGLVFALKECQRINQGKTIRKDGYLTWAISNFASGAVVGASALFLTYPFNYTNVLLANHHIDMVYEGKIVTPTVEQAYRYYMSVGGAHNLYRGFLISALNTSIYTGIYFGMFDTLKVEFSQSFLSIIPHYILGVASAFAASLASYPIQLIRKKKLIQKKKSSLECFNEIVKAEGVMGLYKGMNRILYRSLPAGLALLLFQKLNCGFYMEMTHVLDLQKVENLKSYIHVRDLTRVRNDL